MNYLKTMKEIAGIYYSTYKLPVGTLIKFKGERQRYTVRASNVAFAVCTKPMNALKTVLYTVIDWNEKRRGPEGVIFEEGAVSDESCSEMLDRLTSGETTVSERRDAPLNIERVEMTNKNDTQLREKDSERGGDE